MRGANREFCPYTGFVSDFQGFMAYLHEHRDSDARAIAADLDIDAIADVIVQAWANKARIARALGLGTDYRKIVNVADPLMLRASDAWSILMAAPGVPMSDETGRCLDRCMFDNVITIGGRDLRFTRWLSRSKEITAWLENERGIKVDRFLSMMGDAIATCKRDALITANPLDLLLMSEHGAFRSCHRIAGEYGNGAIMYLNDDQTFMTAILDPCQDGRAAFPNPSAYADSGYMAPDLRRLSSEMTIPRKISRALAWIDWETGGRKFAIGRAYGVYPSAMIAGVSNAISTGIARSLGISDRWRFVDGRASGMQYDNPGAGYFDDTYTRFVRHESTDRDGFFIQLAPASCLACGADTCDHEYWRCGDCSGGTACYSCSDRVSADDVRRGPDGHEYCESCHDDAFSYCESCDEYYPSDEATMVYHNSRWGRHERWVCESCVSDYTRCDSCDEYSNDSHYHAVDTDRAYCDDCSHNVTTCEDCGDCYENVTSGEDGMYRCEDCDEQAHVNCAGTRIATCDARIMRDEAITSEHDQRERCGDCHEEHDEATRELKRIDALIDADRAYFMANQLAFPFLPSLIGMALRDW